MELFWNPVWFWTLNLLCSLLFLGPKSFTFLLNFCYHFSSFYVPVAFAMTEYTSVPTADCIPLHLSCPHCHFDCMPHRVLPHYCFNDSSSPFLLLPISQLHRAYPNCICPSVIRVLCSLKSEHILLALQILLLRHFEQDTLGLNFSKWFSNWFWFE